MASAPKSFACDYLHLHTPLTSRIFSKDKAEFIFLNDQISSLESHISQLNTLLRALHHRSRELHNLHAPLQALPTKVLSYIFQHVVNSEGHSHPDFEGHHACLEQALALSSVSAHFRHVAFGTPELWKKIPLHITDDMSIGRASSLLQHCMALAPNVNISVIDTLDKKQARSAIDVLLIPEVTQKIKAFELCHSTHASSFWLYKLKAASFPILDTLITTCPTEDLCLDFGIFTTVTKLGIYELEPDCPIRLPPFVRYLYLNDTPREALIPLMCQCPNLEECFADVKSYLVGDIDGQESFTLTHLKRLTLGAMHVVELASSAEEFQLPSLEYLRLIDYDEVDFANAVLLCRNVSTTLTTLDIHTVSKTVDHDALYQLCGLPFPNLMELVFGSEFRQPLRCFIRALKRRAGERNKTKSQFFPSLTTLSFDCGYKIEARHLLDLLKEWRVGEGSPFHVEAKCFCQGWSPELRKELVSIMSRRQIKVMVKMD